MVTNILITLFLITFVISLISVRPFIKTVTTEIKFTYVAKEYKSNFKNEDYKKISKTELPNNKNNEDGNYIGIDTQITLNLFENLKYDLKSIRLGQSVKPVYLSKLLFVPSTVFHVCILLADIVSSLPSLVALKLGCVGATKNPSPVNENFL